MYISIDLYRYIHICIYRYIYTYSIPGLTRRTDTLSNLEFFVLSSRMSEAALAFYGPGLSVPQGCQRSNSTASTPRFVISHTLNPHPSARPRTCQMCALMRFILFINTAAAPGASSGAEPLTEPEPESLHAPFLSTTLQPRKTPNY